MRDLPGIQPFPTYLSDDMHKAFNAVCAKLGLAATADKATGLVATKIVELARTGARGDDLTAQTLQFFDPSTALVPNRTEVPQAPANS
jgi:hypothetical protein